MHWSELKRYYAAVLIRQITGLARLSVCPVFFFFNHRRAEGWSHYEPAFSMLNSVECLVEQLSHTKSSP